MILSSTNVCASSNSRWVLAFNYRTAASLFLATECEADIGVSSSRAALNSGFTIWLAFFDLNSTDSFAGLIANDSAAKQFGTFDVESCSRKNGEVDSVAAQ